MKIIFNRIAIAMAVCICFSCKKEKKDDTGPSESGPTVYVTGTFKDAQGNNKPTVWKNGTATSLAGDNMYMYCYGSTWKDNVIYLSGRSNSSSYIWKYDTSNDTFSKQDSLGQNGGSSYQPTDMCEHNGTLYTSFIDYGSSLKDKVVGYWENDAYTVVADSASDACIEYDNGNVYVGGYVEYGSYDYKTMIWKNGTGYRVTASKQARIDDFTISNGFIYVVGLDTAKGGYRAKVWKASLSNLTSFTQIDVLQPKAPDNVSSADVIKVFNGDVYVGGHTSVFMSGYRSAAYWKNGNLVQLESGNLESTVADICVYNYDVYAVSYDINSSHSIGKVWKNGAATVLNDNTTSVKPISIVVK